MSAKSSLFTVSQDEINWARQNSIFIAQEDRAASLYNAMEQGERKAKIQAAKNLLSMHILSVEQIAQVQGLSIEEVESLSEKS